MADSYFELLGSDDLGERFRAGDFVRGTWTAAIQHGGPVSALLVRGLERCEPHPAQPGADRPVARAPAPPLPPLSEAVSRNMRKDWDPNYLHSVDWRWLTAPRGEQPGESWIRSRSVWSTRRR